MSGRLRLPLRALLAFAAAAILPGALKLATRAEVPWALLGAVVLLKVLLPVLSATLRRGAARALRAASTLFTVVFACAVLAGVLITPYSAYAVWFETVRDGEPHGVVSTLIVLAAAVFSSALAGRWLDGEILLPLYGQLLVAAGLSCLIYRTPLFQVLLLCLLAAGPAVLSFRFVAVRDRLRSLAALLPVFLAVVSVSALFLLFSAPHGSRVVDERLHPTLRRAVAALFPRFPLLYGIPGFGYGFDEKKLGGTPILSDAPLFDVEGGGGQSLYLRTAVFDTYDGRSWSRSETGAAAEAAGRMPGRMPPLEWEVRAGGAALPSVGLRPASVRITVRAEYYSLVPFTLDTRRIVLPASLIAGLSGSFAEGFQLADPLRAGQSLLLERRTPGQQDGAAPGSIAPAPAAAEADRWLQLPGPPTPRVRELAAFLADPAGEPRGTLRNIERYLADHCTYNLEVHPLPSGRDFVDSFLFDTMEGYCVHFASAFVVLARLNGIPTRYATGFLLTAPRGGLSPEGGFLPGAGFAPGTALPPEGSFPPVGAPPPGRRTVTGLSAHAWPEVWLREAGWVPWEATTAVNPSYYRELADGWLFDRQRVDNRLTDRQLRAILRREPLSRNPSAGGPRRFGRRLLVPSIPAAALLAALLWALRRYGVLIRATLRPGRASALRLVAKIVSSRTRRGLEPPQRCGWRRWVVRAFPGNPVPANSGGRSGADRLLRVIEEMMYSGRGIRKREVRFLRAFYLARCLGASPRAGGQYSGTSSSPR